jgi:4-hydroxybenzoate polyprenyltransferase
MVGVALPAASDAPRRQQVRERALAWRLGRFVGERFPPASYGTLTLALVLCGQASAALASREDIGSWWVLGGTVIAALLVFLQLRIVDDLRDAPVDRSARPERPLPRGLVTERELLALAVACGLAGCAIAAALGPAALVCCGLAVAQVWVLDPRGRGGTPASGRLLSSALSHSLIVPTVLALAWAASTPLSGNPQLVGAFLVAWGVGLALEVGRKTVAPEQERPGIATYSAAFGRPLALAVVGLFLAVAAAGDALLGLASGAPVALALLPGAFVGAFGLGVLLVPERLSTRVLRTLVPLSVLGLLLWPLVLTWAL